MVNLLDPKTLSGAVVWGVIFIGLTTILSALVRRTARRIEAQLSDVNELSFFSAFVQVPIFVVGFIMYAISF
jgi:uncharacterized protein YqhQ